MFVNKITNFKKIMDENKIIKYQAPDDQTILR